MGNVVFLKYEYHKDKIYIESIFALKLFPDIGKLKCYEYV